MYNAFIRAMDGCGCFAGRPTSRFPFPLLRPLRDLLESQKSEGSF